MPYTLLRVNARGVVLGEYHVRRLGLPRSGPAWEAWLRFVSAAAPGAWAVHLAADGGLRAEARPGTRLWDGMPVRTVPSPVAGRSGALPKPASPGPYDAVRQDGTATLLSSADGTEVYEACVAAVVGWDGERLVCVPDDRPRVWSTAEAAIREHLTVREAPLAPGALPILLVNAVKGTCAVALPGVPAFPTHARDEIDRLLDSLTVRWPLPA